MAESTTLTVRLPRETKDRLAVLASRTRRTSSFLAAEAVTAYVARELAIVEAIECGLQDMAAGRLVPHDVVVQEAEAVIRAAQRRGRGQV